MNVGDLNKVWEVKTLKKKPGEDDARKILERIAKQVEPIMRKRKWRVKLLSEMCPTNPSLLGLNVNRGVNVKLRLRRPNRDFDFIPYDQVLDTMLHELCHNAHGPHNAVFYKLWDELRKECEELMSKGITGTGEGFDLPGKRLGGFSRQPPLSSLRQTALVAAQKRARLDSLLPSGPKRLGGDNTIMVALSPIQAAAMAAERRFQDDIWCGSQSYENFEVGGSSTNELQNSEQEKPSTESSRIYSGRDASTLNAVSSKSHKSNISYQFPNGRSESNFVDLSKDATTSSKNDANSRKRSRESEQSSVSQSSHCRPETSFVDLSMDSSSLGSMLDYKVRYNTEEPAMWECGTCTLLNPPLAPVCKLCSTQKPKDAINCKFWPCKFCTLENSVKLEKCVACGQWRYSHGPPMSTHAPNLGT